MSAPKRRLVLTYISGDCGGLFLNHCCRLKKLDERDDLIFQSRSLKHGIGKIQAESDSFDSKVMEDANSQVEEGVIATSGNLPMLECEELDLKCSGVLVSLEALDALFPEISLVHGTPIERIRTRSQLSDLHDFHKLESMVASAHGRSEVPKLHGRLNVLTFSSPQDAISKREVMHLLEAEILSGYNDKLKHGQSLAPAPETGLAYNVTDVYFFWIIAANFVARKAEKDLDAYPSILKLVSDMRGHHEISRIYGAEVHSFQSRFRVCSITGDTGEHDVSKLDTSSPLTMAINQLKLLSAGLHLSSDSEERIQNVIKTLSVGESLLTPDIRRQISAGVVRLDKDTESWMRSELAGKPRNNSVDDAFDAPHKATAAPTSSENTSVTTITRLDTKDQSIVSSLNAKIGTWDLDILADFNLMNKRPLFFVCVCAGQRDGLIDAFKEIRTGDPQRKVAVEERFYKFLTALESKYINNHYHNACHAADVVNTMTCLLHDGKSEKEMTVLQRVAALVASAAHDVGHTGQNNKFHMSTVSEYAIQYSDQSIMEMHHLATTFHLLQQDDLNMFGALSSKDFADCRHLIIDMILSTDLAKHFSLINNYSIALDSKGRISSKTLLEIVLKAADLGHAVKPFEIHHKWSMLITEEFFSQGDIERDLGWEVPQFMDRHKAAVPKSQIGFLKGLVTPMYELLARILPNAEDRLEQIQVTIGRWNDLALDAVTKKDSETRDSNSGGTGAEGEAKQNTGEDTN